MNCVPHVYVYSACMHPVYAYVPHVLLCIRVHGPMCVPACMPVCESLWTHIYIAVYVWTHYVCVPHVYAFHVCPVSFYMYPHVCAYVLSSVYNHVDPVCALPCMYLGPCVQAHVCNPVSISGPEQWLSGEGICPAYV